MGNEISVDRGGQRAEPRKIRVGARWGGVPFFEKRKAASVCGFECTLFCSDTLKCIAVRHAACPNDGSGEMLKGLMLMEIMMVVMGC